MRSFIKSSPLDKKSDLSLAAILVLFFGLSVFFFILVFWALDFFVVFVAILINFLGYNFCDHSGSNSFPSFSNSKSLLFFQSNRNRQLDRKSTRLNSSHMSISYAVFCLKKQTPHVPPGCSASVGGWREQAYEHTMLF